MREAQPRTPYNFEQRFDVKLVNDSTVRYQKVDQVRVCRLGNDFAVTFYQLDYQKAVDQVQPNDANTAPRELDVLPLTRVVMDEQGFKILLAQVLSIARLTNVSSDNDNA